MRSNRLVCVLNNAWEEEVEGRRGMLFKTKTAYNSPTYYSMMIGKGVQHRLISGKLRDKKKTPNPVNFYLVLFLIAYCLDKIQISYKSKWKAPVQFPRGAEAGRDLWRSLVQPLLKAGLQL